MLDNLSIFLGRKQRKKANMTMPMDSWALSQTTNADCEFDASKDKKRFMKLWKEY